MGHHVQRNLNSLNGETEELDCETRAKLSGSANERAIAQKQESRPEGRLSWQDADGLVEDGSDGIVEGERDLAGIGAGRGNG